MSNRTTALTATARVQRIGAVGVTIQDWNGTDWTPCAVIPAPMWAMMQPVLWREFARQREQTTGKRGRFAFPTPLSRTERKEALLLWWGMEQATPEQHEAVLSNWAGLAPEERWWLVTQAEATRGTPSYDPRRGWRAAIVHILTENGVSQ